MMFVAAIALVSCSDDVLETPSTPVEAGAEVKFGLSLESTRTIYGPEQTTGGKTVFPIYWTNKDKVQIYSPDCAQGRNDAEYEVTPNATQPYADKLTKTGPYGVQWGNKEKAVFYSIYPSKAQGFEESGDDVIANLSVSGKQEAAAMLTGTTYYATDMNNIVMYAKSASTEAGKTVNLQYMPFSTVLDIQVNVDAEGENSLFVESITVEAKDVNIVGDFDLTFPKDNATPLIKHVGEGSNVVAMTFTVAPELDKTNSTLRARIGLMPISNISSLEGWKITLKVKEGNGDTSTYTKTLPATGALVAGKIHKIVLPSLTAKSEWTYNPAAWMPSLNATVDGGDYKKIYLTELSIPGAWYAGAPTSDGYQSTASISDLWKAGVRAFAVECRTTCENTGSFLRPNYQPVNVVVSGTQQNSTFGSVCTNKSATVFISTVIENIAKSITPSEFGVLVLSYADGGSDGQRDADHNYFLQGIKKEIATAIKNLGGDDQHNIYTDEITSETIIQEVLGKLIIKVNVDFEIAKSDYVDDMPALISYVPHINQFNSNMEPTFEGYLSTPLFSKLYWQSWSNDYKTYTTTTANTDFLWCGSSVNRTAPYNATNTGGIPTYTERLAMLEGMISHSQEIYKNSTHNVWFCFACGGTQAANASVNETNAISFATEMNTKLLDIIKRKTYGGTLDGVMVAPDPSPLGIVLFNQCTNDTYKGPDIIKAIIEMNTKFKLKVYTPDDGDGDKIEDPFA